MTVLTRPRADDGALPLSRDRSPHRGDPVVDRLLGPLLLVAGAVGGLVVGRLGAGGQPLLALLSPLLLVPVVLWWRPAAGVLVVFAGTVLVEQFEYTVGPRAGAVTARIPLFHSLAPGTGVTSVELLLVVVVIAWALRAVKSGERLLPRGPLALRILLFAALAVVYFAVGVSRGGDPVMALWEARPFIYLAVAYVLAASLLGSRRSLRAMLWVLVLGSAVKAAYGIAIWMSVRSVQPRPEAVLAHEESFFFGLYAVLVLALWVFEMRGPLRRVSTLCLPVVLLGDMVNSRRTAWAILILASVLVLVVGYVRLPHRRRKLRGLAAVGLAGLAVYLPAAWSGEGTLAQPARAIRSVVAPDARDEASNQYRYVEDANLRLNIQASGGTGVGFGQPINYVIGMVDLRAQNKSIAYVPHNGVLYVWLRLGLVGEVLLWLVVLQALINSCALSAAKDREIAVLGTMSAAAVVAWVVMGEKDMGFTWFRMAFFMGILLGTVDANLERLRPGRTT